ncbi:MAG: carbamoyltransferase C-terminal domain-containing protein [Gemmatimonadota bacterium]|nr:carbamoyltransferase C-terminal domain-containing protein [Gemmatimonadota bacterium]
MLGITTGVDSGAAVVEDGRVLAAVNEERLARSKLVEGFPRDSIRTVLRLTSTRPETLSAVLVGATDEPFVDELEPFDGWFQRRPEGITGVVKSLAGPLSRLRDRFPFLERAYYALMEPSFRRRRRGVRRILEDEFGLSCPVRFVDHHFAHVASAYFTSGFEDALVVSVDGGGDGLSSLVYAAEEGRLQPLHRIPAYDSLGNWYAYVTHLCGFKAQKHEGKITGLAAHGEPRYLELLRELVDEQDGTFENRAGLVFLPAIRELESRLPDGWRKEDLAASVQRLFEEALGRYVAHWRQACGARDVALAGGVFANVRVNQVVHELPGVDRIFVHPGMTDGGLGVGAALAACDAGVVDPPLARSTSPLPDVFLGPGIEDDEADRALASAGLEPEPLETPIAERIAALLAEGYVVARAAGRMEYGPRALGNRSILYQPTDPSVNDWLNRKLDRTEFMPFAPAVLHEMRERCFEDVEGAEHAAEFMTVTFDCTPWMRRHMPGVVHVDGTARPQLVRRDRNPGLHEILLRFHERTGLPGIVNTSFNRHEEPIVCTAEDAVRAFLEGGLDYLALGGRLVRHPRSLTRSLRRVRKPSEGRDSELAGARDG